MDEISIVSSSRKEKDNKLWIHCLVVIITLARIGQGLCFSISGPTLLFLAENVNSDVTQVSAMFSGRSLGVLLGSIGFSVVVNRFPNFKTLLSLGLTLAVHGLTMFATPFMTSLAGLIVVSTIGGLMFGYFDAGVQALYLKLWGEENSRPYIQSVHFGFSAGAFLAPVIAKPFLEMSSQDTEGETNCPNGDGDVFTTPGFTSTTGYGNTTTSSSETNYFNPTNWSYIIIGTYVIVFSICVVVIALMKIEDRVQSRNVKTTESRAEEPVKDVWILFVFVLFYYFCLESLETVFASYIYSIAVCSSLQFSVSDASLLNSLFWGGFGLGRFVAILHSNYFTPTTIIAYDLFGTTLSLTMMSIYGEDIVLVTWIATFYHGLCCATLYSCGVSWTSRVTNVSRTYMFLFAFGNSIGAMTMLPAGGALFDSDPYSVIYLLTGLSFACIIFFGIMNFIAQHRGKDTDTSEALVKSDLGTEFEVKSEFETEDNEAYLTAL